MDECREGERANEWVIAVSDDSHQQIVILSNVLVRVSGVACHPSVTPTRSAVEARVLSLLYRVLDGSPGVLTLQSLVLQQAATGGVWACSTAATAVSWAAESVTRRRVDLWLSVWPALEMTRGPPERWLGSLHKT